MIDEQLPLEYPPITQWLYANYSMLVTHISLRMTVTTHHMTYSFLLFTRNLLADYFLPITYTLYFNTYHFLLLTYYLLPNTYYLVLITHYSLPITYYHTPVFPDHIGIGNKRLWEFQGIRHAVVGDRTLQQINHHVARLPWAGISPSAVNPLPSTGRRFLFHRMGMELTGGS